MSHICNNCNEKIKATEEFVEVWKAGYFHVNCLGESTTKELLTLVGLEIQIENGD